MMRRDRLLAVSIALATAVAGCTPKKSSSDTKNLATQIVCDVGNNWWLYMLAGSLNPAISAIIGTTLAVANSQLQKTCTDGKTPPPTIGQIGVILRDDITQVVDDSFRDEMTGLMMDMQGYNPGPSGDSRSFLDTRFTTAERAVQNFEDNVDQLDRWAVAWTAKIALWREMIRLNVNLGNNTAAFVDMVKFSTDVNDGASDLVTLHMAKARKELTKKAKNFFEDKNRSPPHNRQVDTAINYTVYCRYVWPLNSESNTYLDSFSNQDDAPKSLKKRRAFDKNGAICDNTVPSSADKVNDLVNDKINELSRDLQTDMIDNSKLVQGLFAAKADAIKAVAEMRKKLLEPAP